jgi:dihydrofolate synthase/folylpolyglutamate synthase
VVQPALTVITPIDFDHESFLGGTIEQIAAEKAGILKPGASAVFAAQRPEAVRVLEARAAELHVPLKRAEEYEARDIQITARGSQFNGITCPLAGEHQLANAITAVLACEALGVPPQGIAEARWPGRLEVVAPNPDILLDGAHNPAGARALARYLERFYSHRRRWMIFGAMRDKAIEEIGGILFPLADELIFTAAGHSRSLRPEALREIAGRGSVAANVGEALDIMRAGVTPDDLVIITGSLFLVGEAREHFQHTRQRYA